MDDQKDLSLYKKIFLISMLMSHGLSIGKLYLYHILLMLTTFYGIFILINGKGLRKNFITKNKVIVLFFLYSFFHCFFVKDFYLVIQNQVYIILGISVFFSIKYLLSCNSNQTLNMIKKVIYLAIFVAILEILKIYRWYNSGYDISFDSPSAFLGNTNNFATAIIIVMPFIFFMKNRLKKIVYFLLLFYILISCDSRANNIALSIELFIYFLLKIKEKRIIYKIRFLLGIPILFMMLNIYTAIVGTALIRFICCNGIMLTFVLKYELFGINAVINGIFSNVHYAAFRKIVIVRIRALSIRIADKFKCIMRIFFCYRYEVIKFTLVVCHGRINIEVEVYAFKVVIIISMRRFCRLCRRRSYIHGSGSLILMAAETIRKRYERPFID